MHEQLFFTQSFLLSENCFFLLLQLLISNCFTQAIVLFLPSIFPQHHIGRSRARDLHEERAPRQHPAKHSEQLHRAGHGRRPRRRQPQQREGKFV